MPIAELNPYQQRFCLRARVTTKSQMRYWDKPTSKGNLFSVDLLDASGEIRGTFFKETADKVFPILEEGKVYTFQETSGRLKPANKQYTSLTHEFELTFGNVTVEACDDDAGISQIKGDWQPLSLFSDGGGPRDGNLDVVAIVRKAEPVGTIISSKSGKELTKREVVLCDDSGFDIRCTFWGDVALKEDAFWDKQPTLCAKGLRVGDFGGVSLSSGFSSQLLWDSQDQPRSVELRQWWSEGGKEASTMGLTGGGGGMQGRDVPFTERGVLEDIKSRQLGYGEKPDYIGVAATLNFVRSEKLWYEACASEGCQKKVVQNTDGTWMCEKCNSTSQDCQRRYIVSCTFIDDSGQQWVSAFNESALELFGKVDADQLAIYKEEVDGEDGKFEAYMKQFNFQRYVLKLRVKAEVWNETTRVKASIADVKLCDYKAESAALVQALA